MPPILQSFRQRPDKVICRDLDRDLTAAQVLAAGHAAAGRFTEATTALRIGILLPNGALGPAAFLGAIMAGKVPVLLNPLLKPAELDFILKEAAVDTVMVARATEPLLTGLGVRRLQVGEILSPAGPMGSAPAPAAPDDTAALLYTSGTTGRPKGVPLTHRNLLDTAGALIARLDARSDDVFLGVLPLFHAFGLIGTVVVPWLVGAETTYCHFGPDRVIDLVVRRKVTAFLGVPSMYRMLVRSKAAGPSLDGLRRAICGGDALPSRVEEAYRQRFGHDLLEGYGLTETSAVVSVNIPTECRPGTAGRPLPGVEVRICTDDSNVQPSGGEGEIQVRGFNVMPGYFDRPEENSVALTPDGWFRSGDRGFLDPDGYLTVSGRIKELIVRDGEKIMPREVEDILEHHPGVLEAAVVGEPDGDRGQAVVAYVVPFDSPPTAEALRLFCRVRLAEFKVPRRFVIAADLPRGPSGKILKRLLRDYGLVQPALEKPPGSGDRIAPQ